MIENGGWLKTWSGRRFHRAAVCVVGAAILFAALTGPRCHCQVAGWHHAALTPQESCSDCSGTRQEFRRSASSCCEAESLCGFRYGCSEESCPCAPCSCHDANPVVYAESVTSSLRPNSPAARYSCWPFLPPRMPVLVCRYDGRGANSFETSPKLCARLCRFLI
jgi:hypothetical protein